MSVNPTSRKTEDTSPAVKASNMSKLTVVTTAAAIFLSISFTGIHCNVPVALVGEPCVKSIVDGLSIWDADRLVFYVKNMSGVLKMTAHPYVKPEDVNSWHVQRFTQHRLFYLKAAAILKEWLAKYNRTDLAGCLDDHYFWDYKTRDDDFDEEDYTRPNTWTKARNVVFDCLILAAALCSTLYVITANLLRCALDTRSSSTKSRVTTSNLCESARFCDITCGLFCKKRQRE